VPRLEAPGTPLTASQVASLRARRTELSNQLISADGRRTRLVEQLRKSDGAERAGLEERISLLDRRIVQIESDIAQTGRLLTTSPTLGTATTAQPVFAGLPVDDVAPIAGIFTVVVLGPLAVAAARLMWKRGSNPPRRPAVDAVTAQRLERIEQAVDAIALEVERVSEGQRFVTRLLTGDGIDGSGVPSLAPGQRAAEPIRVPEGARVRRDG
jgi:hypothetical protein